MIKVKKAIRIIVCITFIFLVICIYGLRLRTYTVIWCDIEVLRDYPLKDELYNDECEFTRIKNVLIDPYFHITDDFSYIHVTARTPDIRKQIKIKSVRVISIEGKELFNQKYDLFIKYHRIEDGIPYYYVNIDMYIPELLPDEVNNNDRFQLEIGIELDEKVKIEKIISYNVIIHTRKDYLYPTV